MANNKSFMVQDGTTETSPVVLSPAAQLTRKNAIDAKAFGDSVRMGIPPSNPADREMFNAFTHKTDNLVPSAKEIYTLNFLPNILDNYDTYTYHWKLFLTPLNALAEGTYLNPALQTIIAESGVSDLTIDKVEINSIAIPSVEAGTGTQTTFKFQIVEPTGASLLDKLFYEALALGISNWYVMPVYLQLEFRGRDPMTTDAVINGAAGGLGEFRWVWPIKFSDSKVNVTHVGTVYDIDAILYDELAQSNSYFGIQHNITLSDLTTFKDAIDKLSEKLNADQYEKLIDNYSIPDTYTFVIDPIIEQNCKFVTPDNNKNTSRGADYVDLLKKTATYTAGTGVDKIIDSLLGVTDYFQTKIQNSATSSSEPRTAAEATDQMKKMWRIITETKPIGFDMLRQTNANAITIFIIEYDIGVLDVTAAQTGDTTSTLNASRKRINEYIKKKILNKKYNYIFTGLNDQVISVDLKLNHSFSASMARFGGIYGETANVDKGIVQQNNAEIEKNVTKQIRETLQFVNTAKTEMEQNAAIEKTVASINTAKINDETKLRYTTILRNAKPAQRQVFTNNLINTGGADLNGNIDISVAAANAKSLARPSTNGLKFVSDVNVMSPQADQAYKTFAATRGGKLRPVSFRESNQESNLKQGIDPASNAGRSRVSSAFATALYSSLDGNLQTIKMNIKGDPYWLFPASIKAGQTKIHYRSKMPTSVAIADIKQSLNQRPSVNIHSSDNYIVLRFRSPRIYDVAGGPDDNSEVETFSGVYKVATLVSRFEMGKFTQELFCIIDPMIDLADFLNDMEINAGKIPQENKPTDQSLLSYAKEDRLPPK